MAERETVLSCDCGSFQAILSDVSPTTGTHLRCHCRDCRAFVKLLIEDAQPKNGVHLFQTDPDKIDVEKGQELLECLTLGPNGLLRWYASCCKTPLFITPRSAKIPMVSVLTDCAKNPKLFGPVICDAFVKTSAGKTKTTALPTVIYRFAKRMISARLSGRWKTTPFFILPENLPFDKPYLVHKDERRRAYRA